MKAEASLPLLETMCRLVTKPWILKIDVYLLVHMLTDCKILENKHHTWVVYPFILVI